jgi:hypothetical protein
MKCKVWYEHRTTGSLFFKRVLKVKFVVLLTFFTPTFSFSCTSTAFQIIFLLLYEAAAGINHKNLRNWVTEGETYCYLINYGNGTGT